MVALAVVLAYAAINHVNHHVATIPGGRAGYIVVVSVLAGTVVPTLAMAHLARRRGDDLRAWGLGPGARDAVGVPLGLAAGAALLTAAAGGSPDVTPARVAFLAVHLVPPSVAETLVFIGVPLHALGGPRRGRARTLAAMAACSVAFGLYHFTFYPPWNTWAVARRLMVVWLIVSVVFLLTRSLWAAAAFNTLMAVTGFLVENVRILDDVPLPAGVILAAAAVAAPWVTLRGAGLAPAGSPRTRAGA